MEQHGLTYLILILWIGVAFVLFGQAWSGRRPVAGLLIAYWFQLWLNHWLGGLIHTFSWYESRDREASLVGFEITGYAMVGLLAGNVVARALFPAPAISPGPETSLANSRRLSVVYILVGLGSYFFVGKLVPRFVSGLGALISSGFRLAIAGFCLQWFLFWQAGQRIQAQRTLILSLIIPFLTVSLMGFMGFGVVACMIIGCFVGVFYRPRATYLAAAGAVLFLGISLYPTYMNAREKIRKEVWGGASMTARLNKMALLLSEWQWFDTEDKKQLNAVNGRLNQNYLVGQAVSYLDEGHVDYAHGKTLQDALLAMIPRVLWPDKPSYAGSGDLVTHYTGILFAKGTSVGIGHVMEMYVNFSVPGVFIGFLIMGLLLGVLDLKCGGCLQAGHWKPFVLWYGVGLSFLHIIGNFAEATSSAVGTVVLCLFVNALIPGTHAFVSPAGVREEVCS